MIKLYTIKDWLTPDNRKNVHPLLFDLWYYEHTEKKVFEHYELVEKSSDATFFIVPIDYFAVVKNKLLSEFKEFLKLAKKEQKKVLIYTSGDYGKTFKDPSVITWRNAGFKSTNANNTVIIPALIQDPLKRGYGTFFIHEYAQTPAIAFTGYATDNLKETIKLRLSLLKRNTQRLLGAEHSDYQKYYNAPKERYFYLKKLEHSSEINTAFIYRGKYRAGAATKEEREKTTKEFFENILNAPYTFCLRGAGNFSVRFFESLACGRIPVLVDTDVQLPLEEHISWHKHICIVKENEDIVDSLLQFHKKYDKESFKELQESNRKLFHEFLVRHEFFCKLHNTLIKSI